MEGVESICGKFRVHPVNCTHNERRYAVIDVDDPGILDVLRVYAILTSDNDLSEKLYEIIDEKDDKKKPFVSKNLRGFVPEKAKLYQEHKEKKYRDEYAADAKAYQKAVRESDRETEVRLIQKYISDDEYAAPEKDKLFSLFGKEIYVVLADEEESSAETKNE